MPRGRRFSSTCATPPSSTKRRVDHPVTALSSAHAAVCRTCARPVATTSSSQRWTSAAVAGRASTPRSCSVSGLRPETCSRCILARRGLAGKLARGEGARRVALAAVEQRSSTAAALHELTLPAQRADDAGLHDVLLDVLAVRVTGAADERSKATASFCKRLAAYRTRLPLDDLELRLLLPFERLGVVARTRRLRLPLLGLLEAG